MRLFNAGTGYNKDGSKEIHVPTVKKIVEDRSGNAVVKEFVRVPKPYSYTIGEFVEHKEGNVYLSLGDYGFHVIERGQSWNVPGGCSVKAVRDLAPHLVDEAEYLSMKEKAADPVPASEPKPAKTAKEK